MYPPPPYQRRDHGPQDACDQCVEVVCVQGLCVRVYGCVFWCTDVCLGVRMCVLGKEWEKGCYAVCMGSRSRARPSPEQGLHVHGVCGLRHEGSGPSTVLRTHHIQHNTRSRTRCCCAAPSHTYTHTHIQPCAFHTHTHTGPSTLLRTATNTPHARTQTAVQPTHKQISHSTRTHIHTHSTQTHIQAHRHTHIHTLTLGQMLTADMTGRFVAVSYMQVAARMSFMGGQMPDPELSEVTYR